MRKRFNADLALRGLPQQNVLAAIVSLMQYTGIPIGSNSYEKIYGSFGLSTLKNEHVEINGNELRFCFRGKKVVYQKIALKSKNWLK